VDLFLFSLEAMAQGLPLVAPRSVGLTAYANYDNAWLTEPAAESFAAASRSVFSNPSLRKNASGKRGARQNSISGRWWRRGCLHSTVR
jgi:glycosyltransferase involved in cell wall biosynthesis